MTFLNFSYMFLKKIFLSFISLQQPWRLYCDNFNFTRFFPHLLKQFPYAIHLNSAVTKSGLEEQVPLLGYPCFPTRSSGCPNSPRLSRSLSYTGCCSCSKGHSISFFVSDSVKILSNISLLEALIKQSSKPSFFKSFTVSILEMQHTICPVFYCWEGWSFNVVNCKQMVCFTFSLLEFEFRSFLVFVNSFIS